MILWELSWIFGDRFFFKCFASSYHHCIVSFTIILLLYIVMCISTRYHFLIFIYTLFILLLVSCLLYMNIKYRVCSKEKKVLLEGKMTHPFHSIHLFSFQSAFSNDVVFYVKMNKMRQAIFRLFSYKQTTQKMSL